MNKLFTDLDFARESPATFIDPRTGEWHTVGPDVPRVLPGGATFDVVPVGESGLVVTVVE